MLSSALLKLLVLTMATKGGTQFNGQSFVCESCSIIFLSVWLSYVAIMLIEIKWTCRSKGIEYISRNAG